MVMKPFTTALIIPTGIGASIGGFGGDAMGEMNLLASVSERLITHPNVANAAMFQNKPAHVLYVEGYALDQFFLDEWRFVPCGSQPNKIGVVFDSGIEPRMLTLHLNVLNAVQTVYGVHFIGYTLTQSPVEVACQWDGSGASSGSLANPDVVLNACERLVEQGAEAIALCVQMPELSTESTPTEELYKSGQGVDPVGGIEALLSHLVVSHFKTPCAHAPVFTEAHAALEMDDILDPRTASEYITSSFLPCVLTGLHRAPRYLPRSGKAYSSQELIAVSDVDVLVVPGDALGSIPVLSAVQRHIPVIAVAENKTVMDITPSALQMLIPGLGESSIIQATTYYEAAGMIQALKQGLSVPFLREKKVKAIDGNLYAKL